jgi:hypothetical protein
MAHEEYTFTASSYDTTYNLGSELKYTTSDYRFIPTPVMSVWQCYMFGNKPGGIGIIYTPRKGDEPNWFVRWMMKICFDCTWVKVKK